ncbi:hypothetical protein [Streptomyces sp. NBRC 109706]|uniref:hypothetical protein n=1 Tax=Streptomyces sp. NBRC 109706 TaxID=1550035 RepID=UPI000783C883|nr:hypothetical protein [Streptomyces sp. NBRC 109706]
MEALLLLIAFTAIFGVLVLPALRRRRERQEFERAVAQADAETRSGPPGISLSKGEEQPAASAGLVPVDQLDVRLPGPDDALVHALEEARGSQDWRPAGQLLALTDDSEQRWQRVQSLAGAAAMELAEWRASGSATGEGQRDAGWLRRWRAEEPRDPGGAQVYAQFLVWQAMADPSAAEYRIILEEARAVCAEAAELAPEDPVPHITELVIARGLDYPREEFGAVWQRVTERDKAHMGAHLAALPYWSEKWHGSRTEAEGFARTAAGSAEAGSLLPALPLFAVYDHLPDMQYSPGMYQGAVVSDAIEAARFALHNVRPDHPMEPHVRHLLLCFLVRAERYPEAAEQVRAVDGYVGAIPWVDGENPAAEYATYRAIAIARR